MSADGAAAPPIRVGFVGVGLAGQSHLFDAVTRSDVEVVAVCGRRSDRAAAVADTFAVARAYASVDDLLAVERPDGVVVATPPRYLALHALEALRRGSHVLLEKPGAASGADLQRLVSYAQSASLGCAVAYTRRYKKGWHDVRELIRRQELGVLREIRCRWQGPYRSRYAARAPTYRCDPFARVGGVVLDSGCHIVDLVHWLTGGTGVVCDARLALDDDGADVAADWQMLLPGELSVSVEIVEAAGEECNEVLVYGTAGTLTIREHGERVEVEDGPGRRLEQEYVERPIVDLVRLVRGATPLGATLAEAAAAAKVVFSIYARAGSTVCADKRWLVPRAKPWGRRSGAC